jgi:hypothetical protein
LVGLESLDLLEILNPESDQIPVGFHKHGPWKSCPMSPLMNFIFHSNNAVPVLHDATGYRDRLLQCITPLLLSVNNRPSLMFLSVFLSDNSRAFVENQRCEWRHFWVSERLFGLQLLFYPRVLASCSDLRYSWTGFNLRMRRFCMWPTKLFRTFRRHNKGLRPQELVANLWEVLKIYPSITPIPSQNTKIARMRPI